MKTLLTLLLAACTLNAWVVQGVSKITSLNLHVVQEVNGTVAVGADSGTVFKSTVFGGVWSRYHTGTARAIRHVAFLNADTGYAAAGIVLGAEELAPWTDSTRIFKTTNGGATWSTAGLPIGDNYPLAGMQLALSCGAINDWGYATNGISWCTTLNRGNGWQPISNWPVARATFAVSCAWACGVFSKRLNVNTLIDYQQLSSYDVPPDEQLTAVHSISVGRDTTGAERYLTWVVGNHGYVARSQWYKDEYSTSGFYQFMRTVQLGKDSTTLNAIRFVSASEGLLAGDSGVIYETLDSGNTWSKLTSGTLASLQSIAIVGNAAYVVGDSGVVIRLVRGSQPVVEQIKSAQRFVQLYPVPATSCLTVMNPFAQKAQLTIYTIGGQPVQQLTVQQRTSFSVKDLPAGVYFGKLTVGVQRCAFSFTKMR